jgi:hypothetical protein
VDVPDFLAANAANVGHAHEVTKPYSSRKSASYVAAYRRLREADYIPKGQSATARVCAVLGASAPNPEEREIFVTLAETWRDMATVVGESGHPPLPPTRKLPDPTTGVSQD